MAEFRSGSKMGEPGLKGMLLGWFLMAGLLAGCSDEAGPPAEPDGEFGVKAQGPLNPALVAEGQEIFRLDTYGNETFWTDSLALHQVIQSSVTPEAALGLGLKVDLDALPQEVIDGIVDGSIPLDEAATTVTLLKLGAVVGVVGTVETVDGVDNLTRVGITCALCHSTVDNAFTDGIGHRLDGWPNRDLDVGKIVILSEAELLDPFRSVYEGWGPGMYDPRFNQDGQNIPVVIPPAFGLRHVAKEIYTGDDVVSYWNAYVAITQMHGHGTFTDDRIDVSVNNPPDMVSSKLDALRAYQYSLTTPQALDYDPVAAARGRTVFNGVAKCQECHRGSTYTDINSGELHTADEVGQDEAYALRSATKQYRTTPLRGLWNPPQLDGPYFHDGSATTLEDVVDHYVAVFGLTLTAQQRLDLVEYLKSL
jgi:hypothetical protein